MFRRFTHRKDGVPSLRFKRSDWLQLGKSALLPTFYALIFIAGMTVCASMARDIATTTPTDAAQPSSPSTPPTLDHPPVRRYMCGDVDNKETRNQPGGSHRFLVYDHPTGDKQVFGPPVMVRTMPQVLNELRVRLCADRALLVDLAVELQGSLGADITNPERKRWISTLSTEDIDDTSQLVFDTIKRGDPLLYKTDNTYDTWYYRAGVRSGEVPELVQIKGVRGQHSTFLTFTNRDGKRHYWRLEGGFQPSWPRK